VVCAGECVVDLPGSAEILGDSAVVGKGAGMQLIYPKARWTPLVNHSQPGTISQRHRIVLHITDGSTAIGAIQTFRNSVAPHRVSAHFVIDRDGTVYQLVDVNDTAWHASACNSFSVGIEHVAVANKLLATEAQYTASAELVAWLCKLMRITCDRTHVITHNEASPQDGHTLCCTGGLDPDRVVEMAKGQNDVGTNPQV
jgi:N-acetyl-anhydromuramyl-L-alanine amidase AmpD